jgi:hypothetical protein
LHHICVAVRGVRWRSTAVGALQKPLRFGPWRSMAVNHAFRDRPENHGVPGSNPGPATSFARWGRRGGLRTLTLYGCGWFALLAGRRWEKIAAEQLAESFTVL